MDMIRLPRHCLPAALAALLATACATGANKPAAPDVASNPVPAEGRLDRMLHAVGLAKNTPPAPTTQALPLHVFTAPNLNAGTGTKPLALVVKVYHLRAIGRFEHAPFDALLDNDTARAALGDDLVDSREMLLLPDRRYDSTETLAPEAHYLGFVALFRQPAAQRWRFAYAVAPSLTTGITLGVHACALTSTSGALETVLADDAASLAGVRCPEAGG